MGRSAYHRNQITGTIFTEHFRRWLMESNWSEKDEQEDQGKSKGKVI